MAKKDNAIGKRLKIDKANQNMLFAVAGAALILGICLVFAVYFLRYIKFNSTVISEKNKAIAGYSNAIRNIGICKKPSGELYTNAELNSCNPDEEDVNRLTGSLRHEIIVGLAQNEALESVGRKELAMCYDTSTNEKLSFERIYQRYRNSTNDTDRATYLEMIGACSALRVIPDALPSTANPLALGASLNRIFKISKYDPDGITPGRTGESSLPGIGSIGVSLEIEATSDTTMRVLDSIEKSIREINMKTARIEQSGSTLKVSASAEAFYTEPAVLTEGIVTVRGDGQVTKQ